MSKSAYLIIHNDHPLRIEGINSGAEMATLSLAWALAAAGARVVVAGQLDRKEQTIAGVEFWDLGASFDVSTVLERARALGSYHLLASGRAQSLLESRREKVCRSRMLICHSRPGGDIGVNPEVLTRVVDAVICVSNAQKEIIVELGANPDKVHVIYNGVDQSVFQPGEASSRNTQQLVFAGALVPDKGIQLLIPAFARLKEKYPELTLDVFGTAQLWGREPMFDAAAIQQQVPGLQFHGNVPQSTIAEAYRTAGIAVIPSIWFDSFPLSAIEAQVCGCPVVASEVGGLPEAIQHQRTGLLLSEISEDSLIRTLDSLLASPEKIRELSRNALETARPFYTWARVADEFLRLVDSFETGAREEQICIATGAEKELRSGPVGFLSTWNQECGLATYGRFLTQEFDSDSIIILAEKTSETITEDEANVVRCWKRDDSDYGALLQAIEVHDIAVLHINGQYRFFEFPAFESLLRTVRESGVRVVVSLHSAFSVDPRLQLLIQNVDMVLTHTPEVRLETIANGAAPDRVRVVPHGVVQRERLSATEQASLRRQLGMPENEKIIVAFGFVQPHKGMDAVLGAVHALSRDGIAATGYIAGKPNPSDPNSVEYQNQLIQIAENGGIGERIHFLNTFLNETDVVQYLQAADLVLMNYQSQHYEASGACSLALGAGALVATSVAPAFAAFGDAVWHMTAGYPADLSARLLFSNETLASAIREKADEYCRQNAWSKTAERIQTAYRECGVRLAPATCQQETASTILKEKEELTQMEQITMKSNPGMKLRVLMQNRSNALTQPGGDTIVMQRSIAALTDAGVEVVLDLEGNEDPAQFDLVHIYNFATPGITIEFARKAREAGTPFVVTTLCEDAPAYRNQAMVMARYLIEYVEGGYARNWFSANMPDLLSIPRAARFQNDWVVQHAAALLTNGREESRVLCRDYGTDTPVIEVPLGYDFATDADPELFVREYGVRDFVLCVGRLEFRKNQLMLLKALEDSSHTVVLASGGFSYDPQYADAVKAFNRNGRTIVTDRLSEQMLASAYAAARVHALPSWYELPGLVSLEAAHHGCGIVASLYGTSADYLGDLAQYCDPAKPDSILRAVESAMENPNSEALQNHVRQYTWDAMGERLIAAYATALNRDDLQPEKEIEVNMENRQESNEPQLRRQSSSLDSGGYDMASGTIEFQETLERGELAAKNKEYNVAHDLLFRAEQMNPESVRMLRARGAVFLAENQVEQARRYFERAFEFDNADAKTLSGLGMCFMHSQETRKAYECFIRALAEAPDSLVAILQLLECSYSLNKFDDLVRVLRAYLEIHPADNEMRYCLSGALFKQGMYREANDLLETVLAGDGEHIGANQLKELLDETLSDQVVPVQESTSAIDREVEAAVVPDQRAGGGVIDEMALEQEFARLEELKSRKQFAEVEAGCGRLLDQQSLTDDQRERSQCLKAEVSILQGKIADASALLTDVLRKNPSCFRALCGKGTLAATAAQWSEAERYFQQALAASPGFDVALAGLGLCASSRNDSETAWKYYMQALNSNPENMRALLGILEIGYPSKRFSEIELVLQRYIDMHPGDTEFLYSLAGCYFVQGKVSEALDELNKLILLAPEHEAAQELSVMIQQQAAAGSAS